MKSSYLAIAAFALVTGFSSCSKSDSDSLPTNYKIDGVHDITLQPTVNPTNYMQLNVSYVGKVQERIDLSTEGLPAGCGQEISVTGGYPEFSSLISFTDTSVSPGTYPMKLICVGSKTGRKSYDFNLIVKPEPDYGTQFIGAYPNTNSSCASPTYTATITAGDKVNKIMLNNFDNNGTSVYALVTYYGQTLTIPQQTINGVTYTGSANVYNGPTSFYLYYTKTVSGSTQSCTVWFNK